MKNREWMRRMVQTGRGRYNGKYLGRGQHLPRDPAPKKKRPTTCDFTCPVCEAIETTRYEYCFAISACGTFLRIEPQPTWGHVDGGWTVRVDAVRRVAPVGWESAVDWPASAETRRRPCTECTKTTEHSVRPRDGFEVTTCNVCGDAYPDDMATRIATVETIENWVKRNLAKVHDGRDGQPRGVQMPTYGDVVDDAELDRMLRRQQEQRG